MQQPSTTAQQAKVLGTTNFLDTTNVPLSAGATSDAKMEQDNQKLFSLYNAVNTLAQLTQMAQSSTATSGQLAGLNTRFQTGPQPDPAVSGQSTDFNSYNLQLATPAGLDHLRPRGSSFADYTYSTKQLVTNSNLNNRAAGRVGVAKLHHHGQEGRRPPRRVTIDLSQVPGTLNLTNIVSYINSQLSAAGFQTRFQKTQTGGTATSDANATYGLQITPGGIEQVSLSADSTPALYMVGNSGNATETSTVTNCRHRSHQQHAGRPDGAA